MSGYDEYLALSGLQHYAFCRRQWALIHLEQAWKDNVLTAEGHVAHENAHNEKLREHRGDTIIVRALAVHSRELRLRGVCDVVEFHRGARGFSLPKEEGLWHPVPIEYKRGESKAHDADRLQLCAQALCLEEMLACDIPRGFLFYRKTRKREAVDFSADLREKVASLAREMHEAFVRGATPAARRKAACQSCSLKDICLQRGPRQASVSTYMERLIEEALT